jgi:FlaG/FlaF family flagellin (archaellin)
MRISGHRRRGVSVVVAEVVMIAVLLVAAVMLAGVTFGIFSFYYQPAEVVASGAVCSAAGNTTTCQITLSNEGLDDAATTGDCSLQDGTLMSGAVVGGGTVPAGGTLSGVKCVAHGTDPIQGSQVSGSLLMTNGASAFFIGTLD